MRKTLGIVRVAEDGKKFYKPDVSDDVKPLKGKFFKTLEDGIQYKTYAKLSGFEVRKSIQYNRKDGKLKQKYIACSREGFKSIAPMDMLVDNIDKQETKKPKEKQNMPSCRCGWLAKCIFEITNENNYAIYAFDEEHNNPFVDEDDIPLLKSSREVTFSKKQLLFRVSNNNIGPMKAFKMMKELFRGFDEIGATSVDCRNFKRVLDNMDYLKRRGTEGRLGQDYLKRIKQYGFIDVANKKDGPLEWTESELEEWAKEVAGDTCSCSINLQTTAK
ncbi:FAR1 DNA binding domain, Zinc finger, SWIM-type, MULE transposase domain, FHY3/FAR1 family [Artemisia annua]|uniref:FAR1 DNA binding domain, Zinc finger, SWIM-type, MULE transposase domain, FHY3/FAR1 family n=1 Tax=Artemisia annua TaxID=35608 RepID=A0A2U1LYP2_ARTAN|nr:FAR1 DNA binding domain, Zinc finger, SWIM-type, MULE transposase domain, FHY3/FAR1 family [Artemisia annua]